MTAAAFAPAHITGFFAINLDPDPLKAGSTGCGFCLMKGVTARNRTNLSINRSIIRLNGKQIDLPTLEYMIEYLLGPEHPSLNIDLTGDVPLGYGFGMSGASVLASALVVNNMFNLNMTVDQVASAAHVAEVVNRTGMGDVAGQCAGGVVIRTEPGTSGIGKIDRISVEPLEVSWVCLGEISTASVLNDLIAIEKINKIGKRVLKALLKRPTLNDFMDLSREFAIDTGLISSRALDAVEAVEAHGGKASMAMLGDTVFAIGRCGALEEFGPVGISRIGISGAHYL
jgi:pantoate kinase